MAPRLDSATSRPSTLMACRLALSAETSVRVGRRSTATATAVTPATLPATVANDGLITISFSPDVGDRLEKTGKYVHVMVAVDDGSLPASISPLTGTFIVPQPGEP